MKRTFSTLALCIVLLLCNCRHHSHNTEISYTDSRDYYTLQIKFDRTREKEVEHDMDREFDGSTSSFVNTQIDGDLTLNDHTTIYMKKYAGYLKIRLDKHANSEQAYLYIKSICEQLGKAVGR